MYDILIIGSGPAGLTAAIYATRANKKTALIEGMNPYGQLATTSYVENYPGFANPISGPDLMKEMYQQAKNLKTIMIMDQVLSFTKKNTNFEIQLQNQQLQSKTIIICTGASSKLLGIESKLIGKGISTCATCDGNFFKNKDVAVIGGGDTAVEEALYLSKIVKKVYLIHRRNEFKAEAIMQEKIKQQSNIEILTPYETKEFIGEKSLEAIKIQNIKTEENKTIEIQGAFIAIGQIPNTKFLNNQLELTEQGHIKNAPITEISGVFAAGDVFDSKYKQAITSAGYGCIAALEAIKYLERI